MKKCFFVHIPKTGGISVKANLQNFYEFKKSLHVYIPEQLNGLKIQDYDLVTGHITPFKKDICDELLIVTWVRNPVDRLISQYFYQEHYDISNSDSDKHYNYTVNILKFYKDIVRYASKKENQNVISKDYFSELNLKDYDFIGLYEDFQNDLKLFFQQFFNYSLYFQPSTNYNTIIPKTNYNNYNIDIDIRKKIAQLNRDDMELYYQILELKR